MTEVSTVAQECALFKIRKASRAVTQIYDHFMHSIGLKPTQFSLLVALAMADRVTVSRLAQAMVMDRTTLTRNLKPLQRDGLIRVLTGTDRRTRALSLTPKGRETLEQALPLWEEAQLHMAKQLGQEDWTRFHETLKTVIGATQQHG